EAIVYLLAGLGAFLVGFKILSDNVQKLANRKLKQLFNKVTENRLVGVGIGTAITMIIQSSSVTTVMVVGFVNAGVMNLLQATTIIMGANIGTTITAQLVALHALNITMYAMLLAAIGIFGEMFAKKDKVKTVFYALAGLGLVFIGLSIMGDSMRIFRTSPLITQALTTINHPLLLLLIGVAVTAVVQSSSAVTTIVISMAAAGLVIGSGGNAVLYVILGTNIGTTVTALLSSVGATSNGKRAALIHLMFNVFGTALVFPFLLLWPSFLDNVLAQWFVLPGTQIAMFHTFFNVACTIVFLPFASLFMKASHVLIRDRKTTRSVTFFDERLLKTPSVALGQLTKEAVRLGSLAMDTLKTAIEAFIAQDELASGMIRGKICEIEQLDREITEYLIAVSTNPLSLEDEQMISRVHHVIGDFIRIAEISDNVLKYTKTSVDQHLEYSDPVRVDLRAMYDLLAKEFALTSEVFVDRKMELLPEVEKIESRVDLMRTQMINDHVKRLNEGVCSPNNSAVYINFVSNLERVGDHINYVAHSYDPETPEACRIGDE
ncbi:MAG: Na/Pi cotransporter family protein, partial [Bacillota bacterium]|nr:Na/Pi cotransporter family protein [Bacillota bacterium]